MNEANMSSVAWIERSVRVLVFPRQFRVFVQSNILAKQSALFSLSFFFFLSINCYRSTNSQSVRSGERKNHSCATLQAQYSEIDIICRVLYLIMLTVYRIINCKQCDPEQPGTDAPKATLLSIPSCNFSTFFRALIILGLLRDNCSNDFL